jgi:hypothetical protein
MTTLARAGYTANVVSVPQAVRSAARCALPMASAAILPTLTALPAMLLRRSSAIACLPNAAAQEGPETFDRLLAGSFTANREPPRTSRPH